MNADWVFDLTLYVLMFMSFMTWTIAILKTIQFRRASGALMAYDRWVSQQADWHKLVHEGNTKNGADGVVLVQSAVDLSREYAGEAKAHYSFEQLQDLMTRDLRQKLGLVARSRESWLNALASIGSTAPFLGLFGTVWGIMQALVVIGDSGVASITVVAAPIGGALITTAVGIATAVPAVIFFNVFTRRVRLYMSALEEFAERLLRRTLDNRMNWESSDAR